VTSPVTYPDGLKVRINGVVQSTITAQGPGELTGQPLTTFTIELTNGTSKDVVLNQVVVSAFYGTPLLMAQPVYSPGVSDFATVVKPGASASTKYAFSIPVAELHRVTIAVDFDGLHSVAVFTGSTTG
jgi:hypothetical protein